MIGRWQLPVTSPIGLGSLARGTVAALGVRTDGAAAERLLRERFDARHVLLTDSGTSALVLAMRMLAPGGTVALPAWGCIDLTAAAMRAGVHVRLYDLDPATLGVDHESLRAALRRGVDAVVVAHFHGYPADVPGAIALAAEHGVPVIEDAAQAAAGALHGRPLGAFGAATVLSFGRGKGITAGGGGALLLRGAVEPEVNREQLPLAGAGWKSLAAVWAQWALGRPQIYAIPASLPGLRLGEMVYHPAGEPAGISATAMGMLRGALESAPSAAAGRRARAARLTSMIVAAEALTPVRVLAGGQGGFLRLALLDDRGRGPAPRLGVLRGYPRTLREEPLLAPLLHAGEASAPVPGAERLRDQLLTWPTHAHVHAGDEERLARWAAVTPDPR